MKRFNLMLIAILLLVGSTEIAMTMEEARENIKETGKNTINNTDSYSKITPEMINEQLAKDKEAEELTKQLAEAKKNASPDALRAIDQNKNLSERGQLKALQRLKKQETVPSNNPSSSKLFADDQGIIIPKDKIESGEYFLKDNGYDEPVFNSKGNQIVQKTNFVDATGKSIPFNKIDSYEYIIQLDPSTKKVNFDEKGNVTVQRRDAVDATDKSVPFDKIDSYEYQIQLNPSTNKVKLDAKGNVIVRKTNFVDATGKSIPFYKINNNEYQIQLDPLTNKAKLDDTGNVIVQKTNFVDITGESVPLNKIDSYEYQIQLDTSTNKAKLDDTGNIIVQKTNFADITGKSVPFDKIDSDEYFLVRDSQSDKVILDNGNVVVQRRDAVDYTRKSVPFDKIDSGEYIIQLDPYQLNTSTNKALVNNNGNIIVQRREAVDATGNHIYSGDVDSGEYIVKLNQLTKTVEFNNTGNQIIVERATGDKLISALQLKSTIAWNRYQANPFNIDALSSYISCSFEILATKGYLTARSVTSTIMSIFKQSKVNVPASTQNEIANNAAATIPDKNASPAEQKSWISNVTQMISNAIFGARKSENIQSYLPAGGIYTPNSNAI
ncbi:MAG: hypothetical protein JO129_00380 [Candidatus Dependentiae bacterium]|nr:hypothetical protein [Candidatus Dependentiae bacterium]